MTREDQNVKMADRQRGERLLLKDEQTGDPYLDLLCAVIQLAIRDYTNMIRRGRKTKSGQDAEDFLASDYFEWLTNGCIDGIALMYRIDEEIDIYRERKHGNYA